MMSETDAAPMGSKSKTLLLKALIVVALAAAVGATLYAKNAAAPKAEPMAAADSAAQAAPVEKLPTLIDLGATKCIPCKMMAPILEELKADYAGKLNVVFIDVWENPDASKQHKINLIPTQIFLDAEGTELFRHEGFFSREDILAKWKELGVELTPAAS